jgi:hypothetical protein
MTVTESANFGKIRLLVASKIFFMKEEAFLLVMEE